ncbi:MAG: alpha/beta fold hydrolase [Acidobacteriota bacterium]|jgi:pimeloyl-ACP methyl ester carboxylesterase
MRDYTAQRGSSGTRRRGVHFWVRIAFVVWAVVSTTWFLNIFRTRDVPAAMLADDERVTVRDSDATLEFHPVGEAAATGLVFITGGGVAPEAYVPLLRPIAEHGFPVYIVKLPYWMAPLERHKQTAVGRALDVIDGTDAEHWVVAGHSLGGALASRVAARAPQSLVAMVLIGTSHPKEIDLSGTPIAVTKVYATNDGVATPEMIDTTRDLLPATTRWVEIAGGNHSQFGNYGHQLFDGEATISRARQQEITRAALLNAVEAARSEPFTPHPTQ